MNLIKRVWIMTAIGNEFEVDLPAIRIVCPRCDGTGRHVNPSIDGHGLSADDFAEDPDFEEAYFRGQYDVRCEDCNGENVVIEIDYSKLTSKCLDAIARMEKLNRYDDGEREMERRWGA